MVKTVTGYYPNRNVFYEYEVKSFSLKKHGTFSLFHRNGTLYREGTYKNDLREGLWKTWDSRTHPLDEITFKKGLRHGSSKTFHKNGRVESEGHWYKGIPSGHWVHYDSFGNIIRESNLKDKPKK